MEFELERTQLCGYDALLDLTLLREETLEMIVPDACPDILRVVETDGMVLINRREAMDGRVELAGTVKAVVLYQPDGETGLRHLDVTIPFTCAAEGKDVGSGCTAVACARLRKADTRAVNPRKVLVRAEAAVDVTVFSPRTELVCGQVTGQAQEQVEQLTETQEVYLTACVQEKPFTCSDEVSLSNGKPAAAELLKSRFRLSRGEAKLIGSKLIFKGSVELSILYRGEDDGLCTAGAELPFSQIMEAAGVGEDAECELTLALTGAECALADGGDGRLLSIQAEVLAQAVLRESRVVPILADAYSIHENLTAEWANCPMDARLDRGVRSQSIREAWETPDPIREVTDCRVSVGQVVQSWESGRLTLAAQIEVTALCLGEDGEVCAAEHAMTVPCVLDLPEGCQCFCRCEGVGDVYATPAAGGVEVRFSLDFRYCAIARRQVTVISALSPGQARAEAGEQPSLVLRALEGGERLWDVAKAYGTTIADIISANELEGESDAAGKLLLIPRRR